MHTCAARRAREGGGDGNGQHSWRDGMNRSETEWPITDSLDDVFNHSSLEGIYTAGISSIEYENR